MCLTSDACFAIVETSWGSSLPVRALITVPSTVWNNCNGLNCMGSTQKTQRRYFISIIWTLVRRRKNVSWSNEMKNDKANWFSRFKVKVYNQGLGLPAWARSPVRSCRCLRTCSWRRAKERSWGPPTAGWTRKIYRKNPEAIEIVLYLQL